MKKFLNNPLLIIFTSILVVFLVSRMIAFAVIVANVLPSSVFLTFGTYRLHHFVYGNILILVTSFVVIALNRKPNTLIYFLYGIGLGLVLDEFPLWMGAVGELSRKVPIIPGGLAAIVIALLILGVLILFRRKR